MSTLNKITSKLKQTNMSEKTNTAHGELLNTQLNAEETTNSNSQLIEREKVGGTPFWIIKEKDEWFLGMAGYRITEKFQTMEGALNEIYHNEWMLIMHMVGVMLELHDNKR